MQLGSISVLRLVECGCHVFPRSAVITTANAEAFFGIHVQHADRRPANCGQADKNAPIPCEVFLPRLSARMEKLDDLRGVGIDPGEVRALVQIARDAGEREVCEVITAAVFSRDDVFDLESGER